MEESNGRISRSESPCCIGHERYKRAINPDRRDDSQMDPAPRKISPAIFRWRSRCHHCLRGIDKKRTGRKWMVTLPQGSLMPGRAGAGGRGRIGIANGRAVAGLPDGERSPSPGTSLSRVILQRAPTRGRAAMADEPISRAAMGIVGILCRAPAWLISAWQEDAKMAIPSASEEEIQQGPLRG